MLIAEVHQANETMAPVQTVVPNTPEAERMIAMMNKNFPVYVGNVPKDQGLPEDFLMELLERTCCHIMMAEIPNTMWDFETGTLTRDKELTQD